MHHSNNNHFIPINQIKNHIRPNIEMPNLNTIRRKLFVPNSYIRIFPQLINLIKNSSKRFLCSYLSKVINNILHICS